MIVVDTNIIAYLLIPSDRTEQAAQALRQDPEWSAPLLWRSELRNALAQYIRRESLSLEDALRIVEHAEALMAGGEHTVPSVEVLRLASTSGCTAYDCEFVALARDLDVPLVTVDRQVLAKFPETAIELGDYVSSS